MSSSALSHSPMLHRPEPMRDGFVWWRKIPSSCISLQRKIRGICFVRAHLNYLIAHQTGLLGTSNKDQSLKSP